MDKKEVAKQVQKAFKLLLSDATSRARVGSDKGARDVLLGMTAENLALRELGYMTTDNGKLVKYKKRPSDPVFELAMAAGKGDSDAAEKLLQILMEPK